MRKGKGRIQYFRKYCLGFTLFILIFILSVSDTEAAIKLSRSGTGWTQPIDSSNLISGAGSDLTSTYLSAIDATILSISNCKSDGDNWRIDVNRADTLWDSVNLTLSVLRTSDGTYNAGAMISGGTSFVPVNNTATTFFSGSGDHDNITIQYQLSGMSVITAPNNYRTVVTFTIVDTP
jgi:hypothetical protein